MKEFLSRRQIDELLIGWGPKSERGYSLAWLLHSLNEETLEYQLLGFRQVVRYYYDTMISRHIFSMVIQSAYWRDICLDCQQEICDSTCDHRISRYPSISIVQLQMSTRTIHRFQSHNRRPTISFDHNNHLSSRKRQSTKSAQWQL